MYSLNSTNPPNFECFIILIILSLNEDKFVFMLNKNSNFIIALNIFVIEFVHFDGNFKPFQSFSLLHL